MRTVERPRRTGIHPHIGLYQIEHIDAVPTHRGYNLAKDYLGNMAWSGRRQRHLPRLHDQMAGVVHSNCQSLRPHPPGRMSTMGYVSCLQAKLLFGCVGSPDPHPANPLHLETQSFSSPKVGHAAHLLPGLRVSWILVPQCLFR